MESIQAQAALLEVKKALAAKHWQLCVNAPDSTFGCLSLGLVLADKTSFVALEREFTVKMLFPKGVKLFKGDMDATILDDSRKALDVLVPALNPELQAFSRAVQVLVSVVPEDEPEILSDIQHEVIDPARLGELYIDLKVVFGPHETKLAHMVSLAELFSAIEASDISAAARPPDDDAGNRRTMFP